MTNNETVGDVLADLYAMAAKCGGLQYETIHAMTQRIAAAHAREMTIAKTTIANLHDKLSELQRELDKERMDATRWRHARRIFAVDEIENAQNMFAAFGLEGDEAENLKADAAIDAAMSPRLEVIR